jgi:hypothetical protein
MPAYGFFVRHVKNLQMSEIEVRTAKPDARPPFIIEQAKDVDVTDIKATREGDQPMFVLRNVEGFKAHRVQNVADVVKDKVEEEKY